MAKNKNSNYDYIITRARYKSIKTFDHKQMESFCTDVYKSGFEDGVEAANKAQESAGAIDLDELVETLSGVKGIGAKTFENIKAAIAEKFGGGKDAGTALY